MHECTPLVTGVQYLDVAQVPVSLSEALAYELRPNNLQLSLLCHA